MGDFDEFSDGAKDTAMTLLQSYAWPLEGFLAPYFGAKVASTDAADATTAVVSSAGPAVASALNGAAQSITDALPSATEFFGGAVGIGVFVLVALFLVLLIMGKVDAL